MRGPSSPRKARLPAAPPRCPCVNRCSAELVGVPVARASAQPPTTVATMSWLLRLARDRAAPTSPASPGSPVRSQAKRQRATRGDRQLGRPSAHASSHAGRRERAVEIRLKHRGEVASGRRRERQCRGPAKALVAVRVRGSRWRTTSPTAVVVSHGLITDCASDCGARVVRFAGHSADRQKPDAIRARQNLASRRRPDPDEVTGVYRVPVAVDLHVGRTAQRDIYLLRPSWWAGGFPAPPKNGRAPGSQLFPGAYR